MRGTVRQSRRDGWRAPEAGALPGRWIGRVAGLCLVVATWATPLAAQEAAGGPPLVITAENLTAAAEAARGAPRGDTRLRPGDVVRYTLTFTNPTQGEVRDVVLHNPLPAGLVFIAGTATASRDDARLEFSIDGGATYAAEPMVEVVENGRTIRRPAPPERYTDIRWTVTGQIQPGAQVVARYEVRIPAESQEVPPPAAGGAGSTR